LQATAKIKEKSVWELGVGHPAQKHKYETVLLAAMA